MEPPAPPVADTRSDTDSLPLEEETVDGPVIDLTRLEAEAQIEDASAATGAHDNGMDFDDWLALAEEDS